MYFYFIDVNKGNFNYLYINTFLSKNFTLVQVFRLLHIHICMYNIQFMAIKNLSKNF